MFERYNQPMADINIENFYRHIAVALNLLYSNFPSKFALYVDEVAGIDEPDEYGLHSPRYTSGFFALLWLEEEGYMRFADTIREDAITPGAAQWLVPRRQQSHSAHPAHLGYTLRLHT